MRILVMLLCTMMLSVSFGSDASAQTRISVVNIQKIMKDSVAAKSAKQQLSAKQKQFQTQLNAREQALKTQNDELLKQRATLTKDEMKTRVASFRKKAGEAQGEAQKKRVSLDKAFNQALSDIQKNVTAIIGEIAKEKKIALVIPASQTMHYDPEMDISADVLARLNKRLHSLKLAF